MEESLEFDGKRYISSKRAASLVGYTKDYVGQLCRGGKVEARLVGRSWYVSEESIRKHKLGVHYTLHQPIKAKHTQATESSTPQKVADDEILVKIRNVDEFAQPVVPEASAEPAREEPVTEAVAEAELPRNEQKGRPAGERILQERALSASEVQFHQGAPLFFEDSRPLNPEPNRVTRFGETPILPPQLGRPAQPIEEGQSVVRYRAVSGGPVDGVRKGVATVKNVDRYAPQARSHSRVLQSAPVVQAPPRVPPAQGVQVVKNRSEQPTSKATPVIAAAILISAVLIAYLIIG